MEMTEPAGTEGRVRRIRGHLRRGLVRVAVCESFRALDRASGGSSGPARPVTLSSFKFRYIRNMLSLLYFYLPACLHTYVYASESYSFIYYPIYRLIP